MSEELDALVILAKHGDKQAFGQIYETFYKRIYRFIYYMVYDPETASDLTQNTFLKTWKSLSSFDVQKGTLQAFIFAVARNAVIDFKRKKKNLALDTAETIPSDDDIQETLLSKEQKAVVYKTMGFLKEFEKLLIVLRYFEELSFNEIAQVVNKEEGAVRVRVHRILKKMRQYIKEYTYEN
ncbi:MAG: RNA polymerase sigma factor [Patescibacteria group bacterium]|jgi:RNA polymerase sigma-70 factor (ECF subfamily)